MYICVGGLFSLCRKGESVLKVGALGGALLRSQRAHQAANNSLLAELKCTNSYYDDDHPENHYCAMEFRCYLDDSAKGFTYTPHDDC